MKSLNEQQAENEQFHQQVLKANAELVQANKASQSRLVQVIDEEKQKSAEERQQLLAQVTSLINANADAQDKRLCEKMTGIHEDIGTANVTFETQQNAYSEGMSSWMDKSKNILGGISKSRDGVKTKIKADFAVSTVQVMYLFHD